MFFTRISLDQIMCMCGTVYRILSSFIITILKRFKYICSIVLNRCSMLNPVRILMIIDGLVCFQAIDADVEIWTTTFSKRWWAGLLMEAFSFLFLIFWFPDGVQSLSWMPSEIIAFFLFLNRIIYFTLLAGVTFKWILCFQDSLLNLLFVFFGSDEIWKPLHKVNHVEVAYVEDDVDNQPETCQDIASHNIIDILSKEGAKAFRIFMFWIYYDKSWMNIHVQYDSDNINDH